jgi:hypothetical protein
MTTTKIHKRHSDCKGTVLAVDLEVLFARDLRRSLRSLAQDHYQNNCENDGVRGFEIQSLCYEKGRKTGQFMSEASQMTLDWLKESLSDMWEKEIWPPSSPDCEPLDYFMCGVSEF